MRPLPLARIILFLSLWLPNNSYRRCADHTEGPDVEVRYCNTQIRDFLQIKNWTYTQLYANKIMYIYFNGVFEFLTL